MNYILECDSFQPEQLRSWLIGQDKKDTFYILHKKKSSYKFNEILDVSKNAVGIIYEDLFDFPVDSRSKAIDYELFNRNYFGDGIPFFLLDRDGYFPGYGQGNHNAMIYYLSRVPHIVEFLNKKEIHTVYFRNTPHHSIEWLLAKCADYCGVDVIVSQRHVLPWRYSLSKGYGRFRVPINFELDREKEDEMFESNHIEEFVKMNTSHYDKALPSYEKKRLSKNKNRLLNPVKQWREILFRPPHYYAKYTAYKTYTKLAKDSLSLEEPYVVFFLHYQPERTTLPEGYGFCNQLLAIRELRDSLPDNVYIYVKEHPSMFTNTWNPKARNEKFYEMILELPNVVLTKLTQDTFDLIDNSLASATITGTVGIQSYIRKKPVIFFGLSMFKAPGVHVYNSFIDLKKFVTQLVLGEITIENVESGISKALEGSISGLIVEDHESVDYHAAAAYQQTAHFKLLTYYFKDVKIKKYN